MTSSLPERNNENEFSRFKREESMNPPTSPIIASALSKASSHTKLQKIAKGAEIKTNEDLLQTLDFDDTKFDYHFIEDYICDQIESIVWEYFDSPYHDQAHLVKIAFVCFHKLFTREFKSLKNYTTPIGPFFATHFADELVHIVHDTQPEIPEKEASLPKFFTQLFESTLKGVNNEFRYAVKSEDRKDEN
jgi:hypothetical protein